MLLYLDCICGISGDMFLSSLIELGFSISLVKETIKKALKIDEPAKWDIKTWKEARHGIYGTRLEVIYEKTNRRRTFSSIKDIIKNSSLPSHIKDKSISIFETIAKAEAKIHNCRVEEVHFHEIGALDSIVDIIGTLIGIDYLGIKTILSSHLPVGKGTLKSSHGTIPIPAPATLEILKDVPIYGADINAELVTPTGAALVKVLSDGFGQLPPMIVKKVGYGVGKRDIDERPNVVRAILGELANQEYTDTVALLETNVDDYNPEQLGYMMELLFKEGALDVAYVPIYMKKNRPGILIKIICRPEQMDKLLNIMFKECSTSGIRYSFVFRKRLKREIIEINSPWGRIKAKKYYLPDGTSFIKPEYEECLCTAKKYGISLRQIYSFIAGEKA